MPTRGPDRYVRASLAPLTAVAGGVRPLLLTDRNPCQACASKPDAHGAEGCDSCHGTGEVFGETTRRIRFPPGVRAGQRLRLRGLGWPGRNGGQAGDLFVIVRIEG
ncbi:DnaJ C-terminal domain-containing protein [Streptomyces turgidiscabies]|uniref:DnaJ C-terminal domain-containing protein n=1 Tax=Streptomyces turgidiscabies TaxID=85558 RepID=UPI00358E6B2B